MSLRNVRLAPTFNMKTCSFYLEFQYQTYSLLFLKKKLLCMQCVASFPGSHSAAPLSPQSSSLVPSPCAFVACSTKIRRTRKPWARSLGTRPSKKSIFRGSGSETTGHEPTTSSPEWPHLLMFSLRVVTPPSLFCCC